MTSWPRCSLSVARFSDHIIGGSEASHGRRVATPSFEPHWQRRTRNNLPATSRARTRAKHSPGWWCPPDERGALGTVRTRTCIGNVTHLQFAKPRRAGTEQSQDAKLADQIRELTEYLIATAIPWVRRPLA